MGFPRGLSNQAYAGWHCGRYTGRGGVCKIDGDVDVTGALAVDGDVSAQGDISAHGDVAAGSGLPVTKVTLKGHIHTTPAGPTLPPTVPEPGG